MQLLSAGRWLMTSQRSFRLEYTRATIELWCLKDADDVYCTASFDIFARYKKFAVSSTRDEKFATLAITIDNATQSALVNDSRSYLVPNTRAIVGFFKFMISL